MLRVGLNTCGGGGADRVGAGGGADHVGEAGLVNNWSCGGRIMGGAGLVMWGAGLVMWGGGAGHVGKVELIMWRRQGRSCGG